MAEIPRSETVEPEKNPEALVSRAVSAVESKDALDSILSSDWAQRAQGSLVEADRIGGIAIGVLLGIVGIATLKIIEKSALLFKGVAENPEKPVKWLDPVISSFKRGKEKK